MTASFQLSNEQIKKNIIALQKFIANDNLDAIYISSFDAFLNEYVPLQDCHRYYFSGFTGSTAEILVPVMGKVKLFVDGRYWEQAELEVDPELVEIVRVAQNERNVDRVILEIKEGTFKKVGYEADRTALSFSKKLAEIVTPFGYFEKELETVVEFEKLPDFNKVFHLPKSLSGKTTIEKLDQVIKTTHEAYFITAIDSLAWITNCRGYHLDNLSSFLGRGLVVSDKVFVFIEDNIPLEDNCKNIQGVEFITIKNNEMEKILLDIQKQYKIKNLYIDPIMLNTYDHRLLLTVFGEYCLIERPGGLVKYHSIKDETEVSVMKEGFKKADQAIYNTIKWVKENIENETRVTELDLYHQTTKSYEAQGARELSFNTIAGVGANGSIIHYSDPKDSVIIKKDDMILLDSGGYFEGGFATDTTRTFMASSVEPSKEYKKIYTLVLRGLLNCLYAVFPKDAKGSALDAVTRQPLYQHGYNFNHGTGHGVGIHVHEGGVRISPVSNIPMKAGQVVSIEPGIYLPGFAGVRLENIALVKEHEKHEGYLKFESLVYIGFEPTLIEETLLNSQEKEWLQDYEKECEARGTSFRK